MSTPPVTRASPSHPLRRQPPLGQPPLRQPPQRDAVALPSCPPLTPCDAAARLPIELVGHIVGQIRWDGIDPASQARAGRDLGRLRLVSHACNALVFAHQPAYVSHVASSWARAYLDGERHVDPASRQAWLGQARTLALTAPRRPDPGLTQLTQVLRQCDHLQELNLIDVQGACAPWLAVDAPALPGLIRLSLNYNELTAPQLSTLPWARFAALTSLRLQGNALGAAGNAAASASPLAADAPNAALRPLAQLTRLRLLDLSYNELGPDSLVGLQLGGLTQLRALHLDGNRLGDAGVATLAEQAPPGLLQLRLGNNAIGPRGARALARLPDLRALHLGHNQLGDDGAAALGRAAWPQLVRLRLGANHLGPAGVRALQLQRFAALRELDLSDNELGGAGAPWLALGALTQLRTLDLGYNALGAEGLLHLAAQRPTPPRLQALRLAGNHLGAAGAQALLAMALPQLQVLELQHNAIGGAGARHLAALHLPSLNYLNLSDNALGDRGAWALSFARLPRLRRLAATHNGMRGEALASIDFGRFGQLTALDLSHNALGEAGASHLAAGRLIGLRHLRLSNTQLGSLGLAALGQAPWPELDVLHVDSNGLRTADVMQLCQSLLPLQSQRLIFNARDNYINDFAHAHLRETWRQEILFLF